MKSGALLTATAVIDLSRGMRRLLEAILVALFGPVPVRVYECTDLSNVTLLLTRRVDDPVERVKRLVARDDAFITSLQHATPDEPVARAA